jgi:hypothetical protein
MIWLKTVLNTQDKDSPLHFLGRFILYSCPLFLVWLWIAEPFVSANYWIIERLSDSFHLSLKIPEELTLFPHTFNTFHIVGFAVLILASKGITIHQKTRYLFIGQLAICVTNFLFLMLKTIFLTHRTRYAEIPFISFVIINQWVLPFSLWLFMVRNKIFIREGLKKCPICGAMKKGLEDHVRSKHGEGALKSRQFKALSGQTALD